MYNIKFVYLFNENVSPALFAKIIRPSVAGQWIMSVPDNSLRSLFTRYDLLHAITGANPYQSGRDTRKLIVQDLDMGRVVAIDESYRNWSSVTEMFYINADGRLQAASLNGLGWYPVSTIVDRYETMVRTYGSRPAPTVLPKQVVKSKTAQMPDKPTPGKDGKTYAAQLQEMTKAERWHARKDLIAKGSNSVYPDAQIAAKRLAANNIAVEKAKLAENVYKTVNPLETTPGVPAGWKDISNDAGALEKFGLNSKYLFDNRYGTGQSVWDAVMRTTNMVVAGKTVVVVGYGWCGRGVAARAQGLGASVVVVEADPHRALEALMDGHGVSSMKDAARIGDVFITVTGNIHVIRGEHFDVMKDGALLANAGHFDVEISKPDLEVRSERVESYRPNVMTYVLRDGRRLHLLAEG